MKVSLKPKLEDASREKKKMNIKICDFFHGASISAATHTPSDEMPKYPMYRKFSSCRTETN